MPGTSSICRANLNIVITPQYVEQAVKDDKGENVTLESFQVANYDCAGRNYASKLARVTVKYVESSETKSLETSYVVKLYARADGSAAKLLSNFFEAEIYFYKEFLPKLNEVLTDADEFPLRVPKFFYALSGLNHSLIFMEDISKEFEFHCPETCLDEAHVDLILAEVARLHAASKLCLVNESFDTTELIDKFEDLTYITNVGPLSIKVIRENLMAFADIVRQIPKYEYVVKYLENKHEEADLEGTKLFGTEWNKMLKPSSGPFLSLRHGDCWNNNFMFRYSDDREVQECRLLDFQLASYGSPVLDLHQLLYPCVEAKIREAKLNDFLSKYYETYSSLLNKRNFEINFSLKELKEDFDSKILYGFVTAISVIPISLISPNDCPDILSFLTERTAVDQDIKDYNRKAGIATRMSPHLRPRLLDMFDQLFAKGFFNLE